MNKRAETAPYKWGYHIFTVEIRGLGKNPGDAWRNACEAFGDDPGPTPELHDWEPDPDRIFRVFGILPDYEEEVHRERDEPEGDRVRDSL